MTWRGEGGAQEREIAEGYRTWANALQYSHPFVATQLLMSMVKTYEHEADRVDTEAGIRGDCVSNYDCDRSLLMTRGTVSLSKALQLCIPLPLTDSFLAVLVARKAGLYMDKEAVNHCDDMQVVIEDLLAFEKQDI